MKWSIDLVMPNPTVEIKSLVEHSRAEVQDATSLFPQSPHCRPAMIAYGESKCRGSIVGVIIPHRSHVNLELADSHSCATRPQVLRSRQVAPTFCYLQQARLHDGI
jgi:hypothetical protein